MKMSATRQSPVASRWPAAPPKDPQRPPTADNELKAVRAGLFSSTSWPSTLLPVELEVGSASGHGRAAAVALVARFILVAPALSIGAASWPLSVCYCFPFFAPTRRTRSSCSIIVALQQAKGAHPYSLQASLCRAGALCRVGRTARGPHALHSARQQPAAPVSGRTQTRARSPRRPKWWAPRIVSRPAIDPPPTTRRGPQECVLPINLAGQARPASGRLWRASSSPRANS